MQTTVDKTPCKIHKQLLFGKSFMYPRTIALKTILEYIFIASYYRQLSMNIKMKNDKIKTYGANKTGINVLIFILSFVENCL